MIILLVSFSLKKRERKVSIESYLLLPMRYFKKKRKKKKKEYENQTWLKRKHVILVFAHEII